MQFHKFFIILFMGLLVQPACKVRNGKRASRTTNSQLQSNASFTYFDPSTGIRSFPSPPANDVHCAATLAKLVELARTSKGTLLTGVYVGQVPEQWEKPGKIIQSVFYSLRKSGTLSGAPPVVFFRGGPGGEIDSLILDSLAAPDVYRQTDFIIVEQRGNGCSSPYPQTTEFAVAELYTAEAIVRDTEFFRRYLLDSRRWVAFGQSYGSIVAYRYLEMFPNSLASIITHGHAPGLSSFDEQAYRTLGSIRVWQDFLKLYPGARPGYETLLKTMEPFPEKPIMFGGRGVGPAVLMDNYATSYLNYQERWPKLAKKLEEVHATKTVDADDHIMTDMLAELRPEPESSETGEGLALTPGKVADLRVVSYIGYRDICGSYPDFSEGKDGCEGFLQHLSQPKWGSLRSKVTSHPWVACGVYARQLERKRPPPDITAFGATHAKIKLKHLDLNLIRTNLDKLTGDLYTYLSLYDPIAPPEEGEHLAKALIGDSQTSRFHLEKLDKSGHEGWRTEQALMLRVVQAANENR